MKRLFFNKAIRVLLITDALVLIAGAMLGPIYALFVKDLGGTLLDASISGGIFALSAALTTLVAGNFTDRLKDSEMIVIFGYSLMGVGFLLYILVDSIFTLFLVQMIIGVAEAIYAPAFDTSYSRHVTIRKAGREWGAWEATKYITAAIGSIIGGFIVIKFGFNFIFLIMALLCFSSALYIYKLPRRII